MIVHCHDIFIGESFLLDCTVCFVYYQWNLLGTISTEINASDQCERIINTTSGMVTK